jgi:hypothetical protein
LLLVLADLIRILGRRIECSDSRDRWLRALSIWSSTHRRPAGRRGRSLTAKPSGLINILARQAGLPGAAGMVIGSRASPRPDLGAGRGRQAGRTCCPCRGRHPTRRPQPPPPTNPAVHACSGSSGTVGMLQVHAGRPTDLTAHARAYVTCRCWTASWC